MVHLSGQPIASALERLEVNPFGLAVMQALTWLFFMFVVVSDCQGFGCSHDEMKQATGYQEQSASIKQLAEKVVESGHLFKRDNALLRIPVVWHVLTNGPANRVSRDRILTEMGRLNDWFSAKNVYYNTSDMFSDRVATADDLKIRFELAAWDPLGLPFDGVRYVNSAVAELCSPSSPATFYLSRRR